MNYTNGPDCLENRRNAKLDLKTPSLFFLVLLFKNSVGTHLSSLFKIKMYFSLKYAIEEILIKIPSVVLTRQTTYFSCLVILFSYFTIYFIVRFEAYRIYYLSLSLQNKNYICLKLI